MTVKCPGCHEELETLLLEQICYDEVKVGYLPGAGLEYDIVGYGKHEPGDNFTCPLCWTKISDENIENQLKEKGGENK